MKRPKCSLFLAISSLLCLCVTGVTSEGTTPPFDTSVSIHSSVANMDNLALESSLKSGLISADGSAPGEIHYTFSVSSANKSEPGAMGLVNTRFAVSSLEGRDTMANASSKREWRDNTEVVGTIVNFLKQFDYASGIRV